MEERLSMAAKAKHARKGPRMINEILRLRAMGLGARKIGKALQISKNTVKRYLRLHGLSEEDSTPGPVIMAQSPMGKPVFEAAWSHLVPWTEIKEVADHGTSLKDLWEERIRFGETVELHTVTYVSFWREFKRRYPCLPLSMHRDFPPGERCEADYKGNKADMGCLGYVDRVSGNFVPCKLFGNVLAFSQLLYVQATHTDKQLDFLTAFAESFSYFEGVPQTSMVDNAKVGVTMAHRYDPDFHPEFALFCEHYKTANLAARAGKPRDKCFIENSLGVFWRWARRHMRARTFHSLGELNDFIQSMLDLFNNRIQRKYGKSRRQKFEEAERAKLLPLPATAYQAGSWKKAKVHPDSHIQHGLNFYSVPHLLRGKEVDVRVTAAVMEVFHQLEVVALHFLLPPNNQGRYRTKMEHLPTAHQAVLEYTPQKALEEAREVGPSTLQIAELLLLHDRHPLLRLRRIQGIVRLRHRYSNQALEDACQQVVAVGARDPRLPEIEQIIQRNHKCGSAASPPKIVRGPNPNLRGQSSWDDMSSPPATTLN
jgi:hypothetical protein